jgi:putative aldouronate transport system permease protein
MIFFIRRRLLKMRIENNNLVNQVLKPFKALIKDVTKRKYIYLMALPVIVYYIIFHYWPIYGVIIAFKRFRPVLGILGSPWIGFINFENFFNSYYFWRLLRNTILLNVYQLIFAFPAPIILALLLNEVRNRLFKRTVQTITYMPHFISLVVVCGLIANFLSSEGLVNDIIALLGGNRVLFMIRADWFRTIFVASDIWQGMGWGSIIYLSALSSIDQELYAAATVDGAGRFKKLIHVTIPGILPTIIILFILRMGSMASVGTQKVLLLYNPLTYETADVISTFIFRKGILQMDYSYSAAVGLFNEIINFILLVSANKLSQKTQETSLW